MYLKKNDTIGIIAPAGFIKESESINQAVKVLKNWGFKVKLAKHLFNKHHHFAGTDKERIEDFQVFLDDKNIKVIWCVRGGYGSIRIIDKLDFSKFKKHPKWIIGYSDITIFHHACFKFGIESIHSFMPTSTGTFLNCPTAIENFKNLLFGRNLEYTIPLNKYNKLGKVTGKIIGGNLTILTSLLGSNYALNTKKSILFIEEIGEYKYQIDRMLRSLDLNGYFKNCNALILGGFTNIKVNDPLFGESVEEIILNIVAKYDIPVCFDFPAGHIANNQPIIFGRNVCIEATNNSVKLNYLHG